MPSSEIVMYVALAACAGAYYIYERRLSSPSRPVADPAVRPSDKSEWRQRWVTTLMRLQEELAEDGRECCVPLVRELIWRLMDGEPNDVLARPPAPISKK